MEKVSHMGRAKLGIALGGGAARGWSHIGVLKRLARAGIEPDIIVGTSIGAVVGGCYVAGQLGEMESFAGGLTRRKVFGYLDFNLSGSGLISGQKLCDRLETHLKDTTIEQLPRKFVAIATELATGHEVWLQRGRVVDAMRASYALPGIFKPVRLNNRWLFDGALVNPIPVSVCRALGARYVIAVNLNSDSGRGSVMPHFDEDDVPTTEEMNTLAQPSNPGMSNARAAVELLRRQFFGVSSDAPGISTVMLEAINIVTDRIARSRLAGDPPDISISPRLADIGLFDFHRAQEMIEKGEEAAERALEEIRRALALPPPATARDPHQIEQMASPRQI